MIVIRRPDHTGHNIRMTYADEQGLSEASVPDPHCLVPTCSGEALAIGRPGHTGHNIRMAMINIRKRYRW